MFASATYRIIVVPVVPVAVGIIVVPLVPCGDDMYEHGGFIVHFFDRALVDRLAVGFDLIDVTDFTEGELPRRLARVIMRVPSDSPVPPAAPSS